MRGIGGVVAVLCPELAATTVVKAGTATVGVWLSRAQRRMIGKGKRARATLLLRTHSATGVSETRLRVTLR